MNSIRGFFLMQGMKFCGFTYSRYEAYLKRVSVNEPACEQCVSIVLRFVIILCWCWKIHVTACYKYR